MDRPVSYYLEKGDDVGDIKENAQNIARLARIIKSGFEKAYQQGLDPYANKNFVDTILFDVAFQLGELVDKILFGEISRETFNIGREGFLLMAECVEKVKSEKIEDLTVEQLEWLLEELR